MKISTKKLKQIIREELVTERLKRFKVYVSGEKEPLILMGKNEREVKQTAHMMIRNSSVKIRKVVKEEDDAYDQDVENLEMPEHKSDIFKVEKLKESWDAPQKYSSPEARKVIDGAIRNYAKDLRKVQGRVVKDWMSKAKAGVIDYFDVGRGLQTGDITKAHPYETQFLNKVLTKDKIVDRFRSYFGGKKGKKGRRK